MPGRTCACDTHAMRVTIGSMLTFARPCRCERGERKAQRNSGAAGTGVHVRRVLSVRVQGPGLQAPRALAEGRSR